MEILSCTEQLNRIGGWARRVLSNGGPGAVVPHPPVGTSHVRPHRVHRCRRADSYPHAHGLAPCPGSTDWGGSESVMGSLAASIGPPRRPACCRSPGPTGRAARAVPTAESVFSCSIGGIENMIGPLLASNSCSKYEGSCQGVLRPWSTPVCYVLRCCGNEHY